MAKQSEVVDHGNYGPQKLNAIQIEGNKIGDSNYKTNKDLFMTSYNENDDDRV